jgi:hypothetical protein
MPSLDERVKTVLTELQTEHRRKVDEKVSGMVTLGFILGLVFAYTGLLGFCSGFALGVVTTHKFGEEAYGWSQNVVTLCSNAIKPLWSEKNDN